MVKSTCNNSHWKYSLENYWEAVLPLLEKNGRQESHKHQQTQFVYAIVMWDSPLYALKTTG